MIDQILFFSDCRPRKALFLQFSYFIWPLSKSGPQYKDKILPADDNFLKIVAVGGSYLEEVRVYPLYQSFHFSDLGFRSFFLLGTLGTAMSFCSAGNDSFPFVSAL